MKQVVWLPLILVATTSLSAHAKEGHGHVEEAVLKQQQANLIKNTNGLGFGPQSPRNIESVSGKNAVNFNEAPAYAEMNLCNIHFHKNAEHAGGEFSHYAGVGDGKGYGTGYIYSGELSPTEKTAYSGKVCDAGHGGLSTGDTIEVHYVHTTAQINPGPTLGACLSDANKNPQLRVEAQVYVLVNDKDALDFKDVTSLEKRGGLSQVKHIPNDTGAPVVYAGSTTGPAYNEKGSPFQVTWSVRPQVAKVNIASVAKWCEGNVFNEDHAHGVRNLVTHPDLLSEIK